MREQWKGIARTSSPWLFRLTLENEFAAATEAAAEAGLGVVQPEVLHFGNHTSARRCLPGQSSRGSRSGSLFVLSHGSVARASFKSPPIWAARDAPSAESDQAMLPRAHI